MPARLATSAAVLLLCVAAWCAAGVRCRSAAPADAVPAVDHEWWLSPCDQSAIASLPFCDASASSAARARDLVGRLTLAEKLLLTVTFTPPVPRLFVPPLDTTECLRGTASTGQLNTTSFPQAIANAASFNRSLLWHVANATAVEARAKANFGLAYGYHGPHYGAVCWSPVINIARDPRWGRVQETYGEDVLLTSQLATHFIGGLQQRAPRTAASAGVDVQRHSGGASPDAGAAPPDTLLAASTCKHFDAYNGPENVPQSRMQFNAVVSARDLQSTFMPAFEACARADAQAIMCSYYEVNGVPSCANPLLLDKTARQAMRFSGHIVGDCGAVGNVYQTQNFSHSLSEAAAMTRRAGVDWDCGGDPLWYGDAVSQGLLSQETLDATLERMLATQFVLGTFDAASDNPYKQHPYTDVASCVNTPEHQRLARDAAQQDIVLLRSVNNALPVSDTAGLTFAVLGPNANNKTNLLGDYSPIPYYVVTPLQAVRERVGNASVLFEPGCADVHCRSDAGFAAAEAAASKSDVVLVFVGLNTEVESEANDRHDMRLPGLQHDLVRRVTAAAAGKPVVVVCVNGGAVPLEWEAENAAAVLYAWYGGQEAGHAIADVLFGSVSPAGRLPYTVYASSEELPPITDYDMTSPPGRTYRYFNGTALWEFGYGLSYSEFEYSAVGVNASTVRACEGVQVSAMVTNTGAFPSDEVYQCYVSVTPVSRSSLSAPRIQLADFGRVNLQPGEQRKVTCDLAPLQLAVFNEYLFALQQVPAEVTVSIGGKQPTTCPSSATCFLTTTFAITSTSDLPCH